MRTDFAPGSTWCPSSLLSSWVKITEVDHEAIVRNPAFKEWVPMLWNDDRGISTSSRNSSRYTKASDDPMGFLDHTPYSQEKLGRTGCYSSGNCSFRAPNHFEAQPRPDRPVPMATNGRKRVLASLARVVLEPRLSPTINEMSPLVQTSIFLRLMSSFQRAPAWKQKSKCPKMANCATSSFSSIKRSRRSTTLPGIGSRCDRGFFSMYILRASAR